MGIPYDDYQKYDRSKEIAGVVRAYWSTSPFKPYHFVGSDVAVKGYSDHLQIEGYRKSFFQSKRDFVVNTMLTQPAAYAKYAPAYVWLHYCTSEGEQCWDSRGRFVLCLHQMLETGLLNPDLGVQIDIRPIYAKLKPFLLID